MSSVSSVYSSSLSSTYASKMAEDLFSTGRLQGVLINGSPVSETRKVRDVEAFLDDLARLEPVGKEAILPSNGSLKNVITFAPEGARGITAYVDGRQTASA